MNKKINVYNQYGDLVNQLDLQEEKDKWNYMKKKGELADQELINLMNYYSSYYYHKFEE